MKKYLAFFFFCKILFFFAVIYKFNVKQIKKINIIKRKILIFVTAAMLVGGGLVLNLQDANAKPNFRYFEAVTCKYMNTKCFSAGRTCIVPRPCPPSEWLD